jgi:hypothetical protein
MFVDLTNKRFYRLKVLSITNMRDISRSIIWKCKCKCGSIVFVRSGHLISGNTKSCGCLQREIVSNISLNNKHNEIHGMSHTLLHRVWGNIKQRCYNSNDKGYPYYGGRGIKMCRSWYYSFVVFCKWAMSSGYKEGLSIDRIDNDRGYAPWNCRWATAKQQANNRRNNRIVGL